MIGMLIGGAVGGCAGGLRLAICLLLIGAAVFHPRRYNSAAVATSHPRAGAALSIAAAVAAALFTIVGLATLALVYRETGSFDACLLEAVSATCNVGFSTGLTPQLSVQGRVVLILAMLLGRVLPLTLLLRCLHTTAGPATARVALRGGGTPGRSEQQPPESEPEPDPNTYAFAR
jgi:trk system potassium uptake protein TrkH